MGVIDLRCTRPRMMFSSFIFRRGNSHVRKQTCFFTGHRPPSDTHLCRCVVRYQGNRYVKSFSCLDQYLCMAFAQLTYRESLRAIEACLRAQKDKLYHMGIRGGVSKSTLADANEARDWRIYADFAQSLIGIARPLYADEELGLDLDNTVYALDASTIDLCLSVFPWALFRSTKSAVKLHTLLDLRGNIPNFYPYLRRQVARCQRPRPPAARARSLLYHGSWLCRFQTAFLAQPGRGSPASSGFGKLEKELSERYLHKEKTSAFSMVKPSETTRTLKSLAKDLLVIVRCFKEDAKVNSMSSYKLLLRLFEEQCVTENGEDGGERIQVRPNKEIASDSLQNPSDPDAGYDGHKGQGYQVQIAETCSTDEEEPALSLITHVAVESANKHGLRSLDSRA